MRVEAARPTDVPALCALLRSVIPDCHPETVRAVPSTWPHYAVVRDGPRIVGAGALVPVGPGLAEIRGLAVSADHRGLGIASQVVEHLVQQGEASERGVVCVTRRPGFFARMCFQEVAPTWLTGERRLEGPDRVALGRGVA